jgi:hypothetical protein
MILMIRGEQRVQVSSTDFSWALAGVHYTFVSYSMAVMGLAMTFKWENLFPDQRDYLILSPLPISGKRLFAAKAMALGVLLVLFAIATNIVLIVVVGFMEPWAFFGHLVAVLGASAFASLFFAAIQGLLVNFLPPQAFRQISPTIQTVAITLLVTMILVMPLIAASLQPLANVNGSLLRYFPPVWFLGVYESLSSSPSIVPNAHALAWTALKMTSLMAGLVLLSYLWGYHRHSRKVLESFDSSDIRPRVWSESGAQALHSCLQTNSYQRAAFAFIGKISDRNSRHRISAALYSGLALALAFSSLFVIDRRYNFPIHFSTRGILETPAVLSFLTIAGWRATFGIPYELSANWIFQMVGQSGALDFRKAIRKWLFVCRILPLYVVLSVFEFAWFETATALTHITFDLVMTAFLVQALFFGFRKVPFTCAFLQSKFQIGFYAAAYLFAFTAYTSWVGELKIWVTADPQHLLRFFGVSAIAFGSVLIYRSMTGAETGKFIYDESHPAYQRLDLW